MPARPAAATAELDVRAAGRVRALLEREGFAAPAIVALGIAPGLGVRAPDVPILRRAIRGSGPLETLVRLFVLGDPVELEAARRQVGRGVDALVDAGLARVARPALVPIVRLTPWRGFVVAHDPDPSGPLWPEHVAGPNPAAETLADVTVRDQVDRALDLGTGCGLLALLAARHARAVVATDVNPHALWLTALNAELNGLSGVEVRDGSLFEPVGAERFELIVSNPPFVISPDDDLLFRHSPLPRDELSAAVVRGTAERLAAGGFGHVLANWIVAPGEAIEAAPARWVAGTGCDVLVLVHGAEDPLTYAVRWNARTQYVEPDAYPRILDRWLAHAEREGIGAIGSGIVVLRPSRGSPWVHALRLDGPTRGEAGAQVRAVMEAQDDLAARRRPEELLASRFEVLTPNRLEQALVGRDGEYILEAVSLTLENGLGLRVTVDPELLPIVLGLDGTTRLGAVVAATAAGRSEDEAALARRSVELIRALLGAGLVRVAGEDRA